MKKVSILLLTIFLMTVLTGCSGDYISITEDESNAIAQYCSYLLLKYDKNKVDDTRLMDYKDLMKELDARKKAEEPIITEVPEKITSTPEPTAEPVNDDNPAEPTAVPTEAPSDVPDDFTEPGEVVENYTLSEALGLSDFTIDFKQSLLADSYDTGDKFFSMTASEGKKLAVVEFTVKNITKSDKRLDMTEVEVKYELTDSKGTTHSPVISFLTNDMQFYNETIGAGKTVTACVVFYVDNDTSPIRMKILGNKTYTINLN